MSTRAPALPAEERRRAILDATLPLLIERGSAVSTKQIAEAAGIAEGTIFRVFPDKDSLVRAAVELAFDPEPTEQALAAIDATQAFEAQLVDAVTILQHRLAAIWQLISAVGTAPETKGPPTESAAVTALFGRHADRVVHDAKSCATRLRALTLALSHPLLVDEPMSPTEIVALLLDGIRNREDA
ncbi:MAG TPA: helix-turn-helix domain-containing protein [Acidimicrobiales bacterium]|nr:helix-turn-helix domain-containing protein [Acidimicrobiales bacterium]